MPTDRAAMREDALALVRDGLMRGLDDDDLSRHPNAAALYDERGATYTQLSAVHVYRDAGETYERFPLAELRRELCKRLAGRYTLAPASLKVRASLLPDGDLVDIRPELGTGQKHDTRQNQYDPWKMPPEEFLASVNAGEYVPISEPTAPAKTADDWARERQENAARAKAERDQWPAQYATVREAIALGFTPGAYGNITDHKTLYAPPTKFYYTPGPKRWPHHADQAQSAMFIVFSHAKGSPDELRDQPVWCAGDAQGYLCPRPYFTKPNLTLPQALAHAVACAEHYQRHFIAPVWDDGFPELTAAEWRELAALPVATPEPQTRDMFAAPPPDTDEQRAQKAITLVAAGRFHTDRITVTDRRAIYGIERLIDRANDQRSLSELPPLDVATSTEDPMPKRSKPAMLTHAPKVTKEERQDARESILAWTAANTIDADPGHDTELTPVLESKPAPPALTVPLTQATLL